MNICKIRLTFFKSTGKPYHTHDEAVLPVEWWEAKRNVLDQKADFGLISTPREWVDRGGFILLENLLADTYPHLDVPETIHAD